jgi:M6 family metalloprotease-like protein
LKEGDKMKIGAFVIILLLLFTASATAQYRDRSRGTAGQCRVERGLIILTQFPDIEPPVKKEYARKRFFRELNEYVQEMSYGKVCIKGDVTEKWITLPDPVTKYRISSRNLEVDKDRVRKLIDDALKGADKDADFSRYSFIVVFLGAKLKEYGMIGLCGYPGMLGWGSEDVLKTPTGQTIQGGVAIYSYQAHLGTLFHDIAHILGGIKDGKRLVPCLYDHDLQARPGDMRKTFVDATINMGFWDPMSCHFYEWDMPPPGISSWTKLRLGWMDTDRVRVLDPKKKSEVILAPLEDPEGKTLAIRIQLTESTYYLIENRQPRGFDKNLPGSGVLIMFGDDRVRECRKGKSPVKLINADPSQEHLAGAAFDLGKNPEFTDREHNLRIRIVSREGDSYKLEIGPY